MTPTPKMIEIAEIAADVAADKHGFARGSVQWQISKDAALASVVLATAHLTKLASEANISVPLAPGLSDGASIARRSIIDSLDSFSKA